jgi:hypothetical protein
MREIDRVPLRESRSSYDFQVGVQPSRRFPYRISWVTAFAAAAFILSSCGTSKPQSSVTTTGTAGARSLVSLVATPPSGFRAEATDKDSGGKAGSIGIAEASSADCDGVGQIKLQQDHWAASELRYFDNNPAYPTTYVLLCVTELEDPSDATQDQEQLVMQEHGSFAGVPAPAPFSVSGIPGAAGFVVGAARQIFFARSRYFVFVVTASASPSGLGAGPSLVTNEAVAQYRRLSG